MDINKIVDEVNKSGKAKVRIDPTLADSYNNVTLFKDKVDKAREVMNEVGLPKV